MRGVPVVWLVAAAGLLLLGSAFMAMNGRSRDARAAAGDQELAQLRAQLGVLERQVLDVSVELAQRRGQPPDPQLLVCKGGL